MRGQARVALAVILCGTAACGVQGEQGNGVEVTQVRELEAFERVRFRGNGLVRITRGEPQSVAVTVDENLMLLVETRVVEGLLTIEPLKPLSPRVGLTVQITLPRCEAVELVGNPTAEVAGVENESFAVSITGNGRATPVGTTKELHVSVVGNGDVRGRGLRAENARVEITGNGDVELHAVEELHVVIEGNGDVRYAGEPRLTVANPGVGDIERVE